MKPLKSLAQSVRSHLLPKPAGMQYRRLGQTNLWVSAVGFGTCQLRRVPQDQALATLQQGFDLGVNFVHTAPDYEGADALVAEAIRHAKHDVHICTQAYDTHGNTHGFVNHFEHLFEEACVRFDRPKIDIFGIACIDDREALGENVWGPKGMVEFLQRKKQEGRIGAIFCTTHGGPDYVETLLKRNIFDALMIAYNPLGFHLLSYSPPPGRHFEHLPSVPAKIFPLAQALGTGLMIMKPLAGGLLCPSKAFPPRTQTTEHSDLSASHILRAILEHDAVSCVVPGTASVAEAEENARAGHGRQPISQGDRDNLHRQVQRLQTTLCSRCGLCDELCSQKLPVSWLFRGGYVNLFPGETFETWDEVEYFHLHPAAQPICSTCPSVTCKCPYGIDIPRSLVKIHEQMTVLKAKGHVCQPEGHPNGQTSGQQNNQSNEEFSARLVLHDIPQTLRATESAICRIYVENIGSRGWFADDRKFANAAVKLVTLMDGAAVAETALRADTNCRERTHFVFSIQPVGHACTLALRLVLVAEHLNFSLESGLVLYDDDIRITP